MTGVYVVEPTETHLNLHLPGFMKLYRDFQFTVYPSDSQLHWFDSLSLISQARFSFSKKLKHNTVHNHNPNADRQTADRHNVDGAFYQILSSGAGGDQKQR